MTVKLDTVAEMWASYLLAVVPRAAPPIQIRECRRAFYAGAHAMLHGGLIGIGDPSVDEEAGDAHLEALLAECVTFKNDVLAGRA